MRKFLSLAAFLLLACIASFAQNPPGGYGPGGGGSGGITQVSSLPATCTVGTAVFLTVASPALPIGQYNCNVTNVFSNVNQISTNTVSAGAMGGVTAAGNEVCDATSTNGSSTLATTANDPAFTASMVGWSTWGSNGCTDTIGYVNDVPIGTITTFTDAHHVITSVAGASITTNAGGLHLKWGPVEDTQLTAAENAAWNYAVNTGNGACYALVLPTGFIVVTQPHFNTVHCNDASTGAASTGATVQGVGRMSSRLMITPNFNFAGCPTVVLPTCFGAVNGMSFQNFGISGGQEPGSNPAAGTCMLQASIDDQFSMFFLVGFGSSLSNLEGFCQVVSAGAGAAQWFTEDGFGTNGLYMNAGTLVCNFCNFSYNNTANINLLGGTLLTTQSFVAFTSANAGLVQVTGSSTWRSRLDTSYGAGTSTIGIECIGTATCDIDGFTQGFGGTVGFASLYTPTGSPHWMLSKSVLSSGPTGDILFTTGSTAPIFDDLGENSFTCTVAHCVAFSTGTTWRTIAPTTTWVTGQPPATSLNCASSASPAVCNAALIGAVAQTGPAVTTLVVDTTAVLATSQIDVWEDSSLGTQVGQTCTAAASTLPITVSARTPGTSFTISFTAPAANYRCLGFAIH